MPGPSTAIGFPPAAPRWRSAWPEAPAGQPGHGSGGAPALPRGRVPAIVSDEAVQSVPGAEEFHDASGQQIALAPLGLVYVHLEAAADEEVLVGLCDAWSGTLIVTPSRPGELPQADKAAAERRLGSGADLISFGRAFISNPDLVERLRRNLPIAPHDEARRRHRLHHTYPAYRHTARDRSPRTRPDNLTGHSGRRPGHCRRLDGIARRLGAREHPRAALHSVNAGPPRTAVSRARRTPRPRPGRPARTGSRRR